MLLSQDIKSRNIRKHSTGGSTGVPLQYITDTQGWSMAWASTFRAWDWYGFYVGEKIFTLGGHSLVSQKKVLRRKDIFERLLMRNYKYTSSEMKSEDFFRLYQNYMRLKPAAIRGYASSLFVFSKFIEENNLKIYPVRLILTTGESLMPMYRAKVQEIFRAPIYDNYGAGDGGISSHECYMHEGLHITEERSIIEIVDSNGLPLNNGEVGHVVSTDLHNYAFPFLRYLVGDMASIKRNFVLAEGNPYYWERFWAEMESSCIARPAFLFRQLCYQYCFIAILTTINMRINYYITK